MTIHFKEGDTLTVHCSLDGQRITELECMAMEDGQTSVATKYRIKLKDGCIARISGNNIYAVKKSA